ncbi:MAG: RDD family protein [Bacteriovoracia bacterium]
MSTEVEIKVQLKPGEHLTIFSGKDRPRLASFFLRAVSSIVDELLLMLVSWVVALPFFALPIEISPLWQQIWILIFYLIVAMAYYSYAHSRWGTTLGKYPFKIYVVDADTGKFPSLGRSCVRTVGYFVSSALMGIGYLMALFHPRKQALHDVMANTLAVRRPSREASGKQG